MQQYPISLREGDAGGITTDPQLPLAPDPRADVDTFFNRPISAVNPARPSYFADFLRIPDTRPALSGPISTAGDDLERDFAALPSHGVPGRTAV